MGGAVTAEWGDGLRRKLEEARRDLLELTVRNRLLSTPRHGLRARSIEIVREGADEVFGILAGERKAMTFLPSDGADEAEAEESADALGGLSQPETDEADGATPLAALTDRRLQTELPSAALQSRLLRMYYDSRTFEEEHGVSALYLAIGFLKWFETDDAAREHHAPLLLVPVCLERRSARSRFRLAFAEGEIATNVSLQARLRADFGIDLPDVPDDEDFQPTAYFDQVAAAAAPMRRWAVLRNDMVLSFFSFAKFLMYRDLDAATWPSDRPLDRHPLVRGLLAREGFAHEPPICGDDQPIDDLLAPEQLVHVLNADSSQTVAIEEATRGRNLVIQGPPGTGKSQTIANLMAAAVAAGKKVLFVSEKRAALEVVKRRLDHIGLGDMCLELHSHKANKRLVLEDLRRTLDLGRPSGDGQSERTAADLRTARDRLNQYAAAMHRVLTPSGLTPFGLIGQVVRLQAKGVPPPAFALDGAPAWTAEEWRRTLDALREIVTCATALGVPSRHRWCGVRRESLLPPDVRRMAEALPGLISAWEGLIQAGLRLAQVVGLEPAKTPADLRRLAQFGERLLLAPPLDKAGLTEPVWTSERDGIAALVAAGRRAVDSAQRLRPLVPEQTWSADVLWIRKALERRGRSWFRWLFASYRRAAAAFDALLLSVPPRTLSERLDILTWLIDGRQARQTVDDRSALGQRAFGTLWRGLESDWTALAAIEQWDRENRAVAAPEAIRAALFRLPDVGRVRALVGQINAGLVSARRDLETLLDTLRMDVNAGFGVSDVQSIPLSDLMDRLKAWNADPESVTAWIAYWTRYQAARTGVLQEALDRLHDGRLTVETVEDHVALAYYEAVLRDCAEHTPAFSSFNGESHEQVRRAFQRLDAESLRRARDAIALAHFNGLPKGDGEIGELAVVRREILKQRRHLPIRQLLKQAGRTVQAAKPVFMMSPISVAQYLEPGALEFDLLLMDEASQVRPVDALGAVARARQMVVVGDDRQLPPTPFFDRLLGDAEIREDEPEAARPGDLESILGLCTAQGVSNRMLRWHYRSRHQSLIAVSNHQFYDDRLYVVPSPIGDESEVGLRFHHVPDGVFDRGRSATNRTEAKVVAEAVMRHAQEHPDLTLGVGAFSVTQRDAILDELERLRRVADCPAFFATGTPEPFFVKNLETIQGDERDVIFVSVGYARDASGFMHMHFGPVSAQGGERRLNVLITRARRRCEVFSSIVADDIDLNRATGRGPQALKAFLAYAQYRILDGGAPTGGDVESPFEEEVARAIRAEGYEVDPQIGLAGFRIDLGVRDPARPGRYLLGIECDGASYHASRSARDRDRLRQQVLQDQGWTIHRIWSPDWFNRPKDELRRVLAALENAQAKANDEGAHQAAPPAAAGPGPVVRTDLPPESTDALRASPYVEAAFAVRAREPFHELPLPRRMDIVARVVKVEGPVHEEEVARRVASLAGRSRAGARIAAAVQEALDEAVHIGQLVRDGRFVAPAEQDRVPVRDRSNVRAAGLRDVEMLPPAEVRAALLHVVEHYYGAAVDEAVVKVARLLGFKITGPHVRDAISTALSALLAQGQIEQRDERLYPRSREG